MSMNMSYSSHFSYGESDRGRHSEEAEADGANPRTYNDNEHPDPPPPPPPFCSVLTTVVDYIMTDPCPLEPREFHQASRDSERMDRERDHHADDHDSGAPSFGSLFPISEKESTAAKSADNNNSYSLPPSAIQVPVIRVFGPILRRDLQTNAALLKPPTQSACLYIHGAFPYLLARPLIAGPDGGPGRYSLTREQRLEHTDWDDAQAVQNILPILHDALEGYLQTSVMSTSSNPAKAKLHTPFIRQLTVVVGRGFYTYCPGPAAPFLRIEYYNPAQRWRIKAALEHGLPDIPFQFYPHPKQYSYGRLDDEMEKPGELDDTNHDPSPLDEKQPEALVFHCYEAHIPYSMQFFKDYNLAGLSYIHLEQALFRRNLPLRPSIRRTSAVTKAEEQADNNNLQPAEQLFLRSNTEAVWSMPVVVDELGGLDEGATTDQMILDNLPDLHQATPPDGADDGSSCHGNEQGRQQLLPSIPTQASSDPSEATKRDLMAANLPGGVWAETKTSCQVELYTTVAHILNVHDVLTDKQTNDDVDKIHWRAVPSLETVWNQERRRMRKLLPPQDDFLSQLQQPATPPMTLNAESSSHSGARLAQEGMERLTRVTDGLFESHRRVAKEIVARHTEQIDRVDVDMVRFQDQIHRKQQEIGDAEMNHGEAPTSSGMTPTDDEALKALEALGGDTEIAEDLGESLSLTPWSRSQQPDHSQAPEASRDECDSLRNFQLIPLRNLTLSQIPYSQASEASVPSSSQPQSASERLELALSQPNNFLTQKMGSGRSGNTIDWLSECVLTQRVERGDGIMKGHLEHVDEYIDPVTLRPYEDIDDEETIAGEEPIHDDWDDQQMGLERPESGDGRHEDENADASVAYEYWRTGSQEIETADTLEHQAFSRVVFGSEELEPSTPNTPVAPHPNEPLSLDPILKSPGFTNEIPNTAAITRPPTRGNFLRGGGTALLPMERGRDHPTWLRFTASYFKTYPSKSLTVSCVPDTYAACGCSITRTRPPPKRKTVTSWAQRKGLLMMTKPTNPAQKRRRLIGPSDDKKDALTVNADHNVEADRDVEEVEWRSSQQALTQSQPVVEVDDCPPCEADKESKGNTSNFTHEDSSIIDSQASSHALDGLGAQGGKLHIEVGGELKAFVRPSQGSSESGGSRELPTPVSLMVVEIHVQCRKGKDMRFRPLALTPQADRDRVSVIIYVLAIDPGGGEALQVVERGCLLVPPTAEIDRLDDAAASAFLSKMKASLRSSMPSETMGKASPLSIECFKSEKKLIQRFAHLVRWKDPDLICSWDTQGAGVGFLIERSSLLKDSTDMQNKSDGIDLAQLCGRTPSVAAMTEVEDPGDPFQIKNEGSGNGTGPLYDTKNKWKGSGMGAEWDERVGAGVAAASIVGRLVFASWKLIAEEVKHTNASYLQAVVATITGERIPFHDNLKLTSWYSDNKGRDRWRVLHYRLVQAMSTIILFDAMDVIGRAGEAARLSGVELSHSFPGIRGSQYKVEGVLLRALQSLCSEERGAKIGRQASLTVSTSASLSCRSTSQTQSPWKGRRSLDKGRGDNTGRSTSRLANRRYFFFSPSLRGADKQEALQVQALTLEPKSGHYQDPVVVCDFTALYPSLMIAYNLCYSTIGGHFDYQTTRDEMQQEGRTTGRVGPFSVSEGRSATILKHHMRSFNNGNLRDRAYIAPTGDIYVSETVVKGVLPQVLDEMLTTRAMLKKAAKLYKRNVKNLPPAVLRQLEARQLALKYVANVTYGYTSATFSGRCAMPLLADTIVECGRRTLTSAINLANTWGSETSGRWKGCSVIYGDTDSIFVRLPGRTVKEAFQFGEEFCRIVTQNNPPPVQLKLEKVYMGSIMQTKKKYCGMKFESFDQRKPEFEAKGIETIRRDQCALTQKVLRNALITLFRHGVAAVKEYLVRQWRLIEAGKLPVSDFILTGRVRSSYRASLPVQAALLQRLNQYDPGRNVRHKERLAYVIVASPGKAVRLSDAVMTPLELMEHWDLHTLNTTYYITNHVNAALQRCLSLEPHRVDVHEWYRSSPKPRKRIHHWPSTGRSAMISSFFGSDICWFCGRKSKVSGRSHVSICPECRSNESVSVELATRRMNRIERESQAVARKCSRCNLCVENTGSFAALEKGQAGTACRIKAYVQTPLANCTCIDCPVLYRRHRAREDELELRAVFQALGLD